MTTSDLETDNPADASAEELTMDVQVDTTSTCERHVVITIPQSEVERYRRKSFDEVAPKAELPGFRAGKAPRRLVESKFRDQVDEQVKSNLVMDSLQKVTDGNHFSAISEPDFDYEAVSLPSDSDFRYEFRIEVRPDFETPTWKGLDLTKPTCELTDADVDAHLARTLARFMPGEAVDGEIKVGDTVILNAEFSLDGKQINEFEELEAVVRPKLVLGDATIEGFDSLVAGKSEGDSFTTTVTISDSAANEDLQGKEVEGTFTIHEARRIQVDEISDAKLSQLGFDSTEELRSFVREELVRQFEYHQQQKLREQIVEELTKDANWDMPESLVKRQTSRELQRMVLELQRSGFSNEQIHSYINNSKQNARQSTINALREHFVLEKIAEDLELEPSAEDYDKEIELIAEQNDSSPRRIRAQLEKSGQMDAIRNQIIERQVIDKITEEGKITEEEDRSFLKSEPEESHIDFDIAGGFDAIPEAKHDNDPSATPGDLKLPE